MLDAAARARVIEHADGDARRLLNVIENLAAANPGAAVLGEAELEATLGEMLRRGDKGGDIFYDTISALHKSVRGSDPDATLYWLARLLDAGMDPRYAARRLVRMASEDIGLADPRALRLALVALGLVFAGLWGLLVILIGLVAVGGLFSVASKLGIAAAVVKP